MILGMIWTIILRFCIQDITVEELHAKEGLLLWCQRKTAPYNNVNVQNFHMSWKDGLAFCALIHRHRPELIDYAKLSKDNPIQNLNYAFDVAEKYLDIPKMLDAEDMVNTVRPDERSVMTYVAAYYHAFANSANTESAASRIAKVLKANQDTEKLMAEYAKIASDLMQWIQKQTPFLADRTTDGTLPGMKQKLARYNSYRGIEKPPKLEDKSVLEALNKTLQTRLKLDKKPAFLPPKGQSVEEIQNAWKEMEFREKGFEDWLLEEIRRMEQLDYLVKKFNLKCSTHEAWSKGKEAALSQRDYEKVDLSQLRALSQRHTAFENDLGAHQSRVERIVAIAEELNTYHYEDIETVNRRTQSIVSEWDRLGEISSVRRTEIDKRLDVLEKIDSLQQSYARRVAPFHNWLEQAQEDLQDTFITDRVEEVSQLIAGHDAFKRTLPAAEKELNDMSREASEVQSLVQENNLPHEVAVNPYTMVSHETLHDRWGQVMQLVPLRDAALEEELARQQLHERLRQQFTTQANKLGPWLERSLDSLYAAQTTQSQQPLEQQLVQFRKMDEEIQKLRPLIADMERCHEELQANDVYTVPYTPYTADTLRMGWEQLMTNVKRAINEVEVQIMVRDARGVSEAQLSDFRRCFNHFDKRRLRRLEASEFKACLVSLGFNIPNTPEGDADFRRILKVVDANNTGYISFDAFMNFMTKQASGSETADQLIESFRVIAHDKPYVTADILRRELPPEQAEYCIERMKSYKGDNAEPNALDYTDFSNAVFGESDL
ncbi:hypothetical protein AAHC03_09735 [Spirometra sp. Aus1]